MEEEKLETSFFYSRFFLNIFLLYKETRPVDVNLDPTCPHSLDWERKDRKRDDVDKDGDWEATFPVVMQILKPQVWKANKLQGETRR